MDPPERLAHSYQWHVDLHLRLSVSSPSQRRILRLDLTNKICPGERRRGIRVPGESFLEKEQEGYRGSTKACPTFEPRGSAKMDQ